MDLATLFKTKKPRGFGSDNHSGVDPRILQSIIECNDGHLPSYGTDPITEACVQKVKDLFGEKASPYFVFNGTAANVLSVRALAQSYQSVACSDVAHLNVDECAAPEALNGTKLVPLASLDGKITALQIEEQLIRRGDQHFSQLAAFSVTQPTELGTVYSLEELRAFGELARRRNLMFHLDGARLVNAAAHLGCSLRELTTDVGVDVVSFGGTKNGLLAGEMVIFLSERSLARTEHQNFKYLRKQYLQLPSKSRYLACQFLTFLQPEVWFENARHANRMATELYKHVQSIPGVKVRAIPQANAVFATIPQAWVKPLREKYFFYVWDESTFECRWMTSWDTQIEDVRGFADALKELSNG